MTDTINELAQEIQEPHSNFDPTLAAPEGFTWNGTGYEKIPDKPPFKLDIGCGPKKPEGFYGIDIHPFEGVDQVVDLRQPWPFEDNSVDYAQSLHVLEHFDGMERVHFMNELHRVLKPGGQAYIVVPHWCSSRAYGDPTHKWPPVSEFFFYYLTREWRLKEAPHTDASNVPGMYDTDFDWNYGYGLHRDLMTRSDDFKREALAWSKEAASDIIFTLTKKKLNRLDDKHPST